MKIKYFLRNEVLHEVHDVLRNGTRSVTIRGTMGTVTVRKNGRDGRLCAKRPFGWGRICGKQKSRQDE